MLTIPRSRLFALERLMHDVLDHGVLGHLAAEIGRIAAQLPEGDLRKRGAAAATALARDEVTAHQRSSAIGFSVEWLRDLHGSCAFAVEPRVDDEAFVRTLRASLHEIKKTRGSEPLSLYSVSRRAKLSLESVDIAVARAFDEELMFHSRLEGDLYAVLLEPDEDVECVIDEVSSQLVEGRVVKPQMRPAEPEPERLADIAIVTIKDEEFDAVLAEFPDEPSLYVSPRSHRHYNLRSAAGENGTQYRVALVRQVEQGTGEAQNLARDLIDDINPALILVVGIAGGVPSDDFTLGDVVLSLRVHDYTVHADKPGSHEYAIGGGPMAQGIAAHVANLRARLAELGQWADVPGRPSVDPTTAVVVGPEAWRKKVSNSLQRHFVAGPRSGPLFVSGVVGSSDGLIKDPETIIQWLMNARNLLAVEMEAAGVFRATTGRCAMLAIRSISDIVGLARDERWTRYACNVAAAFARAYLRTGPVTPEVIRGGGLAGVPPFPTDDVNANLRSAVASKRTKGFALAERAIGAGAPLVAATRQLVEEIALRAEASREDRWRAVDLLRAVGISADVCTTLIREWTLMPESTLGPQEHESGAMFRLLHDPGPALSEAVVICAGGDLVALNRLVLRDLLIGMRDRLATRPDEVPDSEALAWRAFCERCRGLDPSKATANERVLLDAIIKAVDG